MADRINTPGAPPGANPRVMSTRYAPATPPVPTTITRPGKTARSPAIVIKGRIVGTMYSGHAVHHYRVAGADGVLYFCPPPWLPADPLKLNRDIVQGLRGLVAFLEARAARRVLA